MRIALKQTLTQSHYSNYSYSGLIPNERVLCNLAKIPRSRSSFVSEHAFYNYSEEFLKYDRLYQKLLPFLPTICINDHLTNSLTYLESKDHVKYLGVYIDHKLSWKNHIDSITMKLSKTIGLLSKIRHFVPFRTLVSIITTALLFLIYDTA